MRLLHVAGDPWSGDPLNISLCERFGADIPRYVILSHRWREQEVLFSDITNVDLSVARSRKGWEKLESSCRIALQMGINYVWNDTCCIDKTSSAELSEAINSMYRFYARSESCFAYLDDVDDNAEHEAIEASIWFTRAWTLQELIAPKELHLFSKGWKELGNKQSLHHQLAEAAHVPAKVLLDPSCLDDFSVAERMQWAAWREATREEDEAYSLMGIFNVNLPPLYGEGRTKAFLRLQMEIMQRIHDHTIFAWNRRTTTGDMLATSARDFMSQYTYRRMKLETYVDMFALQKARLAYDMTNLGLHIELPIVAIPGEESLFLAFISCRSNDQGSFVAIVLEKSSLGRFTRFFRTAWRNRTVVHVSSLHGIAFENEELWISRRLRPDGTVISTPPFPSLLARSQLSVNPTDSWQVRWTSGFQPNAWNNEARSNFSSGTVSLSVNRSAHSVQVIMFNNPHNNFGLLLALGGLDDTTWVYPHFISLPDSATEQTISQLFHYATLRLQVDCAFPGGLAWRNSRRLFVWVEPPTEKYHRLVNSHAKMVNHTWEGSWGRSIPYKWSCAVRLVSGNYVLFVRLIEWGQ